MEKNLNDWLDKYQVRKIFKSVNINRAKEQPHMFKEKVIKKLGLDIYIEDNLDVVEYLGGKMKTKVGWIYNIFDKNHEYKYKYANLEEALKELVT